MQPTGIKIVVNPDGSLTQLAIAPATIDQQGYFVPGDVCLSCTLNDFEGDGIEDNVLFALCDAAQVGKVQNFSALFNAQGVAFGVQTGTFSLPDFQSRFPLGNGAGSGLTPRAMGAYLGVEENNILVSAIPALTLQINETGHTHAADVSPAFLTTVAGTTWDAGGTWAAAANTAMATTGITMTSAAATTKQPCVHPACVVNFGVCKRNLQNANGFYWAIGDIKMTVNPNNQPGWLPCDGKVYQIADNKYSLLYLAIRNSYGGDGVKTFAVPDLQGRSPMGIGTGPGLTPRLAGTQSGAESNAIAATSVPAMEMIVTDPGHTHAAPGAAVFLTTAAGSSYTTGDSGGQAAATASATAGITAATPAATSEQPNMGPCTVVRFLIRYN